MMKALGIFLWQNCLCHPEDLKLQVIRVTGKIITASRVLKGHWKINNLFSWFIRKTICRKKVLISGFLRLVECIYLH